MSTSPHDALFRLAFGNPVHAEGELRAVLPPEVVAAANFATLRLTPGTFVDAVLGERRSDVLYEMDVGGEQALIYILLEHQSTHDPWMALRMFRYTLRIWEAYLAGNPAAGRLPPIVPIVVAHDEAAWHAATSVHDLVDLDGVLDALASYVPRSQYLVDDLTGAPEDEIAARPATAFARVVLIALKHGRGDLVAALGRHLSQLREVDASPGRTEAVDALLRYTLYVGEDRSETIALATKISEGAGLMGKSAAEQLIDEGFERGLEQGLERGLERGLEQGLEAGRNEARALLVRMLEGRFGALSPPAADAIAHASGDTLQRMADRFVSARSLEEVLQG